MNDERSERAPLAGEARSGDNAGMPNRVAANKLRDLESLTDAALAYFPLDQLLDELLARVVAILEVDTAALLLLEDDDRTLVPHAAHGLEGELEGTVRIPVGRGFAGRVAANRAAVRIDEIEHAEILNPILRDRGLKALLGVPLVVEGEVIGVLHVGSVHERRFDEDDTALLQRAADRAALAIHGRLAERERGLAEALQRSLIPTLPELPGVGLAGRYLPAAAAKLGGDWYDAFPLPGGRLGMAIGDIVGRGFHAAALMGQLRSGLRAYALDGLSPSAVLERLSNLLRQLGPSRSATLVYLIVDPHGGTLTLAGAGHPPPLVLDERGRSSFVELPPSVPLGAIRHPSYENVEQRLEPGAMLVLYTDGLIEQAQESLDDGFERLRRAVREADGDLQGKCDTIVSELLPAGTARDDAALLLARALPLSNPLLVRLPAEVDSIPLLRRLLGRWLDEAGASTAEVDDVSLACSEACANAIEHAYAPTPEALEVEAMLSEAGEAVILVRDSGSWRAPRGTNRGRGLALMEGLTDSLEVIRGSDGTTVRLARKLEEPRR